MLTRYDLRRMYPDYDRLLAYEKIILEEKHNTKAAQFRRSATASLGAILAVALPIGYYFISKEGGVPPNPEFMDYLEQGITGFAFGGIGGWCMATTVYEIFSEEGEVREMYDHIKDYLHRK
jgi:hypothetical protein